MPDALRDLHIVPRTPEPRDLLDDDGGALGRLNREQLEAMLRRMLVSLFWLSRSQDVNLETDA